MTTPVVQRTWLEGSGRCRGPCGQDASAFSQCSEHWYVPCSERDAEWMQFTLRTNGRECDSGLLKSLPVPLTQAR